MSGARHRAPQVREVETPSGRRGRTSGRPARARGTLVLGHGAGGGDRRRRPASPPARRCRPRAGPSRWSSSRGGWPGEGGRPPPTLDEAWLPVVAALVTRSGRAARPLVVGGRSAGARVACRTASRGRGRRRAGPGLPAAPAGPARSSSRADELRAVGAPACRAGACRAGRDPFGTPDEVAAARLPPGRRSSTVAGAHSCPRRLAPRPWPRRSALLAACATVTWRSPRRAGGRADSPGEVALHRLRVRRADASAQVRLGAVLGARHAQPAGRRPG